MRRINIVIRGERGIIADTAVRLARNSGKRTDFRLEQQALYDIARVEKERTDQLLKIRPTRFSSGP